MLDGAGMLESQASAFRCTDSKSHARFILRVRSSATESGSVGSSQRWEINLRIPFRENNFAKLRSLSLYREMKVYVLAKNVSGISYLDGQ